MYGILHEWLIFYGKSEEIYQSDESYGYLSATESETKETIPKIFAWLQAALEVVWWGIWCSIEPACTTLPFWVNYTNIQIISKLPSYTNHDVCKPLHMSLSEICAVICLHAISVLNTAIPVVFRELRIITRKSGNTAWQHLGFTVQAVSKIHPWGAKFPFWRLTFL